MVEIRLHARGGQGAVIASLVMTRAAFLEGRQVQAFPHSGVERWGAPVAVFARFDDQKILLRTRVYEPHHVLVLDQRLIGAVPVTAGLRPGGTLVVNTERVPEELGLGDEFRIAVVDAAGIALRHGLGTGGLPIVNSAMVGAFAAATGLLRIESVTEAVRATVPVEQDANAAAAEDAFKQTRTTEPRSSV
jgi:pyruvate ferredoxin oxidoreductase gamma subunit/2-oxoisovalerate ferredoxin oxidoreductase gamma subunit